MLISGVEFLFYTWVHHPAQSSVRIPSLPLSLTFPFMARRMTVGRRRRQQKRLNAGEQVYEWQGMQSSMDKDRMSGRTDKRTALMIYSES